MEIHQLFRNKISREINVKQTLNKGQIIRAHVSKLFSNGRAQINLGNQSLIAQLEAALAVGKSYHFHVLNVEDSVIHLKVLHEVMDNDETNVRNLLREFQMTPNRLQMNFLTILLQEQIPFQKQELQRAFQLLGKASNKREAQLILKQMMQRGLPLTDNVFQAIKTFNRENVTQVFEQLSNYLHKNNSESSRQIQERIRNYDQTLYQTLQAVLEREHPSTQVLNNLGLSLTQLKERSALTATPPLLDVNDRIQSLRTIIQSLINNEKSLLERASSFSARLENLLANTNLSQDQLNSFIQQFLQEIRPLISEEHYLIMREQLTNQSLEQVQQVINNLSNQESYQALQSIKGMLNVEIPKQQLLLSAKHFPNLLGLNYEHDLVNNFNHMNQSSIKGQLLQLIQSSDPIPQEQLQQFIQYITGAQIQSVQDDGHFIQANLILLGSEFNFNQDIHMSFESRKKSDGKIDPRFCRILFYLDLFYLKETVIDMNVQDNVVSIHVFNERPNLLRAIGKKFDNKLREGLGRIDYSLSNIRFSSFVANEGRWKTFKQESLTREGIDFRI